MHHLISGGSTGLGLEIAKKLIHKKEPVILLGRSEEKLLAAKSTLMSIDPSATVNTYALNISDDASVDLLIQKLAKAQFKVKTLYNCAGTTYFGNLFDITRADLDAVLESSFIGLALMTAKVSQYMLSAPVTKPRIVSILSTAALKGKKNETIYNGAKWGARGFLESVRDELESTPIEIINVFPGGMKTPFWEGSTSGYKVDGFMDPAVVADTIVSAALSEAVLVTDITIGRPKRA